MPGRVERRRRRHRHGEPLPEFVGETPDPGDAGQQVFKERRGVLTERGDHAHAGHHHPPQGTGPRSESTGRRIGQQAIDAVHDVLHGLERVRVARKGHPEFVFDLKHQIDGAHGIEPELLQRCSGIEVFALQIEAFDQEVL